MEQLIKITSEPIRMESFSQNARLVSSNSVDIERRKALARQRALQSSGGHGASSIDNIRKINRAFSKSSVSLETDSSSPQPQRQIVTPRPQPKILQKTQNQNSVPVSAPSDASIAADTSTEAAVPVLTSTSSSAEVRDISVETSSSYTAQRGAFEMRVARGDLTYLPPLVMTFITQRPQVHIEYLGDFNYVPPRDTDSGGNINVFT